VSAAGRVLTAAVALPPSLALLFVLAVAAAERGGGSLFAGPSPANLAEAAASGRGDDVVRRLRAGEDAFRVYDLRPDVISSSVQRATPAEAAMWSRQLLMIHLLDRGGAIGDAQRPELACLASDLGLDDVVEYLSPAAPPTCNPQAARDRVLSRTARALSQ
jgi:hypothetical protein